MARIFWVKCPHCHKRFYAATVDFRHKGRKLWCPFCGAEFLDDEAEEITE